jgi:hypothetical protein
MNSHGPISEDERARQAFLPPIALRPQKSVRENFRPGLAPLATPGGMAILSRVPPLTDAERAALMLEVRRAGETAASRRLGLSRNLMARALARLKIQPGSVLLIRNALAAVASEQNTPQQGAA